MLKLLILLVVVFVPSQAYEGIDCYGYKCVADANAYCDATTRSCKCNPGYIGNGRLKCVPDTKEICTMLGDPHIIRYTGESGAILLPCTQILTEFTIETDGAVKVFFMKVTAETSTYYKATFASQIYITHLYIELDTYESNAIRLYCGSGVCLRVDGPTSYQISEYNVGNLNVNIFEDKPNGQIVVNPGFGVEVRFRGEDGSVSIEVPANIKLNVQYPGLCGDPSDNITRAAQEAVSQSLTYNDYLVFENTANINKDLERKPECLAISRRVCTPKDREDNAERACASIFSDRSLSTCLYQAKGYNDTVYEYINCHAAICDNTTPTAFCNAIDAYSCGDKFKPVIVGIPPCA